MVALLFGVLVLGLYAALVIPGLFYLSFRREWYWLVCGGLHGIVTLGVAIELSELGLSLILPSRRHPRLIGGLEPALSSIAVLYLCCDDVDDVALKALAKLRSFDVFVLDDSEAASQRSRIDATGLEVCRRIDRTHFKAGNLNHWLRKYGDRYKYIVVLDSDSVMRESAIAELVAYAEHPANWDVAIVQASLFSRPGNAFQRHLSRVGAARRRVWARLHDRIGWTLSHGHNALHRVAAVVEAGGFPTVATCEDTLLSLELRRRGWRIIFVDTPSSDAEPVDVFALRKRTVRWARQTVDLVLAFRSRVGLGEALLMARHVIGHLVPNVSILVLIVVAAGIGIENSDASSASAVLEMPAGSLWITLATGVPIVSFVAIVALWLVSARCGGVRAGGFLIACVVNGAVLSFCAPAVLPAMIRSLFSASVGFSPTGRRTSPKQKSLLEIWRAMRPPWVAYVVAAALLLGTRSPLGLTWLWLSMMATAPVLLWLLHREISA